MLSVLYPVLDGAPPLGPDDVLGETSYLGPFEADHSTVTELRRKHPTVIVFHVPLAELDKTATAAQQAIADGVWTRDDVAKAAGPRPPLTTTSLSCASTPGTSVLSRTRVGFLPPDAMDGRGNRLSHGPDETLPERPVEVLVQSRDLLHARSINPALDEYHFRLGFAAALAIFAMGGIDGLAVRRELWA